MMSETSIALFSAEQFQVLKRLGLGPVYIRQQLPDLSSEVVLDSAIPENTLMKEEIFNMPDINEPAYNALEEDHIVSAWNKLETEVKNCRRCRLCDQRTQTVFGVGDRQADLLFIGEAPGEQEDLCGEPFVGPAGKLLDNMLQAIGKERGKGIYIANVLKCRPPFNRNPHIEEIEPCEPFLLQQINLIKPKLIVLLGKFAAQSVLRSDLTIARLRKTLHQYQGIPVIVTYHPAYLLRNLVDKSKAWEDFCLVLDTLSEHKC
jgi:uracil-DNA glycosylase